MKYIITQLARSVCLALTSAVLGISGSVSVYAVELSDETAVLDSEVVIKQDTLHESAPASTYVVSQLESRPDEITADVTTQQPQTADVEIVAPVVASSVVISEIQTRGASGAADERIVLHNASSEAVDITGWCVQYASAGGMNFAKVFCISPSNLSPQTRVLLPAAAWLVAGVTNTPTLQHDSTFNSGMAENGKLRLITATGEVVDYVGWGSAGTFWGLAAPATTATMSLQRLMDTQGRYVNTRDNAKDFVRAALSSTYHTGALYEVADSCANLAGIQSAIPNGMVRNSRAECVDRSSINFCDGIKINEIAANATRQYIELHNPTSAARSIEGCTVMTNRSTTLVHRLGDGMLPPGGYMVIYLDQTTLKLTKTTTGTVYLLASDQETEVDSRYYEDLSSETSWSSSPGGWKQTYTLTPGEVNIYSRYPPCEAGQVRNVATGRCRLNAVETIRKPCSEGQYRSEQTNRCRSLTLAKSVRKPCRDDQFRNPATNRCKTIASAEALADCGEGRERNPVTNRCRNVVRSDVPAAAFAVEPIKQAGMAFAGWWALGGVLFLACAYAGWEWRHEVRSAASALAARIGMHK